MSDTRRTGRVCPVVRQQCLLARGCALFDDPPAKGATSEEQARAWFCYRRGEYLFSDEVKARRFDRVKHSKMARFNHRRGDVQRVLTWIQKRAQPRLIPADESAAAAAP